MSNEILPGRDEDETINMIAIIQMSEDSNLQGDKNYYYYRYTRVKILFRQRHFKMS